MSTEAFDERPVVVTLPAKIDEHAVWLRGAVLEAAWQQYPNAVLAQPGSRLTEDAQTLVAIDEITLDYVEGFFIGATTVRVVGTIRDGDAPPKPVKVEKVVSPDPEFPLWGGFVGVLGSAFLLGTTSWIPFWGAVVGLAFAGFDANQREQTVSARQLSLEQACSAALLDFMTTTRRHANAAASVAPGAGGSSAAPAEGDDAEATTKDAG